MELKKEMLGAMGATVEKSEKKFYMFVYCKPNEEWPLVLPMF